MDENNKIQYIDPMGKPMSSTIMRQIEKLNLQPLQIEHIYSAKNHPQHRDNQNGCGSFLVNALNKIIRGEEFNISYNNISLELSNLLNITFRNDQKNKSEKNEPPRTPEELPKNNEEFKLK